MSIYDSDSDLEDQVKEVSTDVLLGYATKEAANDAISQLGGEPAWIDTKQPPSAALAQCKTCNSPMALLLQLNGELPDHFPDHERRLYVWTCRRKACWRKSGSVRATRAIRARKSIIPTPKPSQAMAQPKTISNAPVQTPKTNLGATLFGAKSISSTSGDSFGGGNPFSTNTTSISASSNPFSTTASAAPSPILQTGQKPLNGLGDDFAQTFAEKARLSDVPATSSFASVSANKADTTPQIPWPITPSALARPFPKYFLDADYEYLAPEESKAQSAHHAAFMDVDSGEGSAKESKEDKVLYEDAIDKTFQRFADTLAQNPEQVLRYEFGGAPLLYSRTDAVGVLLFGPPHRGVSGANRRAGMPRCERCGAERLFEVQLTPQAIVELEEGDMSLGEGMEWGTIVVGVCSKDCVGDGDDDGSKVVYTDEWVGVQWEEMVQRRSK